MHDTLHRCWVPHNPYKSIYLSINLSTCPWYEKSVVEKMVMRLLSGAMRCTQRRMSRLHSSRCPPHAAASHDGFRYRKTLTRRWKAACCMLKSEWILRLPPG